MARINFNSTKTATGSSYLDDKNWKTMVNTGWDYAVKTGTNRVTKPAPVQIQPTQQKQSVGKTIFNKTIDTLNAPSYYTEKVLTGGQGYDKALDKRGIKNTPGKLDMNDVISNTGRIILDPLNFIPVAKLAKYGGKITAPITKLASKIPGAGLSSRAFIKGHGVPKDVVQTVDAIPSKFATQAEGVIEKTQQLYGKPLTWLEKVMGKKPKLTKNEAEQIPKFLEPNSYTNKDGDFIKGVGSGPVKKIYNEGSKEINTLNKGIRSNIKKIVTDVSNGNFDKLSEKIPLLPKDLKKIIEERINMFKKDVNEKLIHIDKAPENVKLLPATIPGKLKRIRPTTIDKGIKIADDFSTVKKDKSREILQLRSQLAEDIRSTMNKVRDKSEYKKVGYLDELKEGLGDTFESTLRPILKETRKMTKEMIYDSVKRGRMTGEQAKEYLKRGGYYPRNTFDEGKNLF
ncbi:MAG TPA: hypothetical protein VEA37_06260, partial [Flavobacterium sp.]|nr:hypothetical protein [Flavobacterium sp.]